MAPNGLNSLSLCRSCLHKSLLSSPIPSSLLSFSTTPHHLKTAIPTFTPTSTPELSTLLSLFRTTIFTPAALSQTHRDLIYKPSRQKVLLTKPGVTVTMSDGEEVKLTPIKLYERPNKKKSLHRLLELLREGRDWQNVPAFLEGMHMGREMMPEGFMERLVRRAGEQGRLGVIIRCVEMVGRTGLSLADPAVTTELMLGIHLKAVKGGVKGWEEMEEAVRQAREVVSLMEREEHCGRKALVVGQRDMRKDLTVLGVILELQAAQRVKGQVGDDAVLGTPTRTAAKILDLWPEQGLQFKEERWEVRQQLERWIPLWSGIKLALQLKEIQQSELLGGLTQARDETTTVIEKGIGMVEADSQGKPRRCLNMYKDLKDL